MLNTYIEATRQVIIIAFETVLQEDASSRRVAVPLMVESLRNLNAYIITNRSRQFYILVWSPPLCQLPEWSGGEKGSWKSNSESKRTSRTGLGVRATGGTTFIPIYRDHSLGDGQSSGSLICWVWIHQSCITHINWII